VRDPSDQLPVPELECAATGDDGMRPALNERNFLSLSELTQ